MQKSHRRDFLKTVGRYSIAGVGYCYLPTAQAGIWSLLKLHPVRFVAGLIFNEVAPILVRWAVGGVVDLFSGHRSSYGSTSYGALTNEAQFNHPAYKAAIVTLGVADFEKHRQRQLRLLLNDAVDTERFGLVVHYLRDERISLKTAGTEISYLAGLDLEPDDLFTLDYFVMGDQPARHYKALENITKVDVFKQWRTG